MGTRRHCRPPAPRRPRAATAVAAAVVVALAGCTSDTDDGSSPDDRVTDGTADGEASTDDGLGAEPGDGATDDGTDDGTEAGEDQDGDGGQGDQDGTDDLRPIAEDADTDEKTAEGSWPGLDEEDRLLPQAVTDVRLGIHDDFDRVVFELESDGGTPGWIAGYGEPIAQGSGEEVEVDGEVVLLVTVRPVLLPPDLPESIETWFGPSIEGRPGGVVHEVVSGTVYEGHHQFFVGLDQERPFVVERLDDPPRVVVDILHETG